jgi:hypothetical protein
MRSPLPADFPDHPEGCDYLSFLRYRLTRGPAEPADADAICVMQPGAWGGAYSLDRMARNTVRAAAAKGRAIEWWSLARRGCGAWDRTGIDAAKEANDPQLALDYYYRGAAINGRRFAGFIRDRDLRFVAELGISQTVLDQFEVLTRELPDPQVRRTKVFCGGHSLGGIVTGLFGTWDFNGVPGYDQFAGLIALDTLVDGDPFGLQTRPRLNPVARVVAGHLHRRVVQFTRLGLLPRTFNFTPLLRPETLHLLVLAGLMALYRGDDEIRLYDEIPRTPAWEFMSRVYFSRTWWQFLTGRTDIRGFRGTGEATFGVLVDDNFALFEPLSVGMGTLEGPVVDKRFPLPSWLRRAGGIGRAASLLVDMDARKSPADPDHLYTWKTHDRTMSPGEVVDIQDYARQVVGGPLGYLEGYFPLRLEYDVGLALIGARDSDLAAIKHEAGAENKPTVQVMADKKSFVWSLLELLRLCPDGAVFAPGYGHVDVASAAARQPNGRPEPVSDAVAAFLVRQTTPSGAETASLAD